MDANGGSGMIINSYCGTFPHSLLSTSKIIMCIIITVCFHICLMINPLEIIVELC